MNINVTYSFRCLSYREPSSGRLTYWRDCCKDSSERYDRVINYDDCGINKVDLNLIK